MSTDFINAVTTLIVQCFLMVYVTLLVVFRNPVKVWARRWFFLIGVVELINFGLIAFAGTELYNQLGVATLLIPCNLVTLWCAQYRDFRTLFAAANSTYISTISLLNSHVAGYWFPSFPWLPLLTQIATLTLLYFPMRRFSTIGRRMMQELERGWVILWLLTMGTCMASMYLHNQFFPLSPVSAFIAEYCVLAVCGVAYYLMYLFFEQVQTKNEMENSQKLLSLQVTGLQSRIQAVGLAEAQVRIERHDLRHRLEVVRELVQQGENKAALDFVDTAQHQLDETRPVRWCNPPVLDAMFASYFSQAKTEQIRVEARLAFPEPLPVEEGELAIVLANALENAIHACEALPEAKREIHCTVIAQPSLMLEVSNPNYENVRFDADGLPLPKKEGHGFGSRSIAAFCQKYDAVYQFVQKDDWFTMRVIL